MCYPGANCFPVRGGTHSVCDFANSTVFVGVDARGAILDGTNFTGANASEADFRGAVLSGACFAGANLFDARIDKSTLLDGAIFCNTIVPNGSVNDAGCGGDDTCCSTVNQAPGSGAGCLLNDRTCTRNGDCCSNFCNSQQICRNAAENCRKLNELCGAFGGRCCSEEGTICTGGILSRCSSP